MPDEWLDALGPVGTDWRKARIEDAPTVGYPADGCTVPDLERKPLDEILVRR